MLDKFENALIILGTTFGIQQIESILGIVILILQVLLVLYKVGYKVYLKIKEKKYDEIDDVVEEGIDNIEDLTNKERE